MFRQVSGEKGDDLPAHAAHAAVSLHPQREVCMSLNSTVDGEVQAHLHTISTITSVYPPIKIPDQHDTHTVPDRSETLTASHSAICFERSQAQRSAG